MKFRITEPRLSEHYCDMIRQLLRNERQKEEQIDGLLKNIDIWLAEYKAIHGPILDNPAYADDIRHDLIALKNALKMTLHTKELLRLTYRGLFPSPQPNDVGESSKVAVISASGSEIARHIDPRILSQTRETHLMRLDIPRDLCQIVDIDELIERLQRTCDHLERTYRPDKGRPADPRINFTLGLILLFERWTGLEAISSRSGTFYKFLVNILAAVTGEKNATCPRTMIESTLAHLKTIRGQNSDPLDDAGITVPSIISG